MFIGSAWSDMKSERQAEGREGRKGGDGGSVSDVHDEASGERSNDGRLVLDVDIWLSGTTASEQACEGDEATYDLDLGHVGRRVLEGGDETGVRVRREREIGSRDATKGPAISAGRIGAAGAGPAQTTDDHDRRSMAKGVVSNPPLASRRFESWR